MTNFLNLFRVRYDKFYNWDRISSKKENDVTFENFSEIIDNKLPIN